VKGALAILEDECVTIARMPRAKTVDSSVLAVLVILATGCGSSPAPTTPASSSPPAPTAPAPAYISILRSTGGQARAGLRIAEPEVKRSRLVELDVGPLSGPHNQAVELRLFDDVVIHAVGIRTERAGEGFVWIGQVLGQPASSVILSVQGNVLTGSVRTADHAVYEIRPGGDGLHRVRELDATQFPRDDVNSGPSLAPLNEAIPAVPAGGPCGGTDFGNVIDVLVAYTDALKVCRGLAQIESEIYGAVAVANQSFLNTGMNQRLNLVGLQPVAYAETGNSCTDVTALRNGDGALHDLLTLRNARGADIVVLLENRPLESNTTVDGAGMRMGCSGQTTKVKGEAFGVLNPNTMQWEPNAFAVIDFRYATSDFTLAHEIGHLMGARHDKNADGLLGVPFADNHGYVSTACRQMSVMATDSCCTRIPYWSNQARLPCSPFGSGTEDNADALSWSRPVVANFRCSSPDRTDVWMRDTWDDTGKEPEPATAQESMWTSPYIWVRRMRDAGLVHQHQHQTPVLNTPVYVYVKLHNGNGSDTSGAVELYYDDSGIGSAFPRTWTLIGTAQVPSFPASSPHVAEFSWTTPPSTASGTGQFAFLARWVSQTDPISNGGPDVVTMTRASNNVVLRNIATIAPIGPSRAVAVIRNLRAFDDRFPGGPMTIRIAPPADEINGSFFFYGRGVITLGDKVAKAWRESGKHGQGFEEQPDGSLLITAPDGALLTDISLEREDTLQLDFVRGPATPDRTFHVEVTQQVGGEVVGGITYELPRPGTSEE
jgi:Metallo-peptidase family M12B Reprolysin-like